MDGYIKAINNDESLVQLARKGDENAMAILISGIVPFVRARAGALAGKNLEAEDLMQEGMLGFLSAVYSYKEGSEATFRTYASICINNRIISAVRSQMSQKNQPLNRCVPLNEDHAMMEDAKADPQDILTAQEETAHLMSILNERLSDYEKKVICMYLTGLNYEQIAKRLNTTTKAVDNALQRAKKKLKSKQA